MKRFILIVATTFTTGHLMAVGVAASVRGTLVNSTRNELVIKNPVLRFASGAEKRISSTFRNSMAICRFFNRPGVSSTVTDTLSNSESMADVTINRNGQILAVEKQDKAVIETISCTN